MTNYTLHFLLSLLLVIVVLLVRRSSLKRFFLICGIIVVPVLSYRFFYNEFFGTIQSWLIYFIGYFGAVWLAETYVSLATFKRCEECASSKKSVGKIVAFFLLEAVFYLLCLLVPWAMRTFPLSNVDAVLFTLFMPVEGADEFVVNTLRYSVFWKGSIEFALIIAVQILLAYLLNRSKIRGKSERGLLRLTLGCNGVLGQLQQIMKFVTKFLLGCALISLLFIPSILHSPAFSALFAESVDSEFYKSEYVEPRNMVSQKISEPKNLVVLFLESMEQNYGELIPEIHQWEERGINFVPGGNNTAGTGWSIAGTTAALCGLPINMPLGVVSANYSGKLPTYLPNAVCVMDLLKEQGYNQMSVQGTDSKYTQVKLFWNAHGNDSVRDNVYYSQFYDLDSRGRLFWGIEDKRMFEFAKMELEKLSKRNKPFAFYISTIDTHMPEGYVDSSCSFNESTKYRNAVRCSSFLLGQFFDWMSNQSWFSNTVVLVVGDHTTSGLSAVAKVPLNEELHTVAFLLNVDQRSVNTNRLFTNLDYAPTILEALGWELPRHGFGLGRSLLSNEPTMLEKYGRDSLDAHIRQRNKQYDYFLLGK